MDQIYYLEHKTTQILGLHFEASFIKSYSTPCLSRYLLVLTNVQFCECSDVNLDHN